jgi:acyl-[acyl-carrier-protein]-phospholipid O-acyltransferase/long-chain-fatty-acid--[acyl-carrier-protein] ligase
MTVLNEKVQKRSLLGLLITQFFGAFNDNAWKVMVFTLATRPLQSSLSDTSFETSSQLMATLSLVIFLIPMMLFSLPAGALADQISKRCVIISAKILEVLIMASCAFSLYLAPTNLMLPFFLLGLMGAQSALFGPAKYGIMPEILPKENLSKGNGILEMWTMIAIIAGTGFGPVLLAADSGGQKTELSWLGPLWLTLLSFIGLIGAFLVSKVPVARTKRQTLSASLKDAWSTVKADQTLWFAVMGSMIYWSMTSLLGQNILVYAKALFRDISNGELLQGIPPASFGCGIAFGAFISGRLSKTRIEYGLIPFGSIGFAISSLVFGIIQPEMIGTVLLMVLMGASSGLLIVPLHAIVQTRSPNEERGSIIALGNFLDVAGMIAGSLIAGGMAFLGCGLKTMLITSALLAVLTTLWAIRLLPKALVRLLFILLTRSLYKLKIVNFDNVPKTGPILLVANHVSMIDALFVMASMDRPVRFVMNEFYYNTWYIHPLAKLMGAIPVSNTASIKVMLQGLRGAGVALDNGEIVCIFPEGQVTHTGKILPFRRGIEIIMRGRDCPIVPVYLDNVWGSIFSFDKGKFVKKWPEQFPFSLTITFGKYLPATTTVSKLRRMLQEMECEAWEQRRDDQLPIHHQLIRNIRCNPRRLMLADKDRKLKSFQAFSAAISLAARLKPVLIDQSKIGILLPTSIAGTVVNLAMTISGRVSVNLNYTVGLESFTSSISQAELKTIITSRLFVEKIALVLPCNMHVIYVEDLFKELTFLDKFKALGLIWLAPISVMEKYCGARNSISVNDPLTIIFTSGSTGEPKGVVLSHFNLSSNVDAVYQVIPYLGKSKNLLASLPLFHSFGYMLMWLGFNHKIGLVTHSNPLEFKMIGELVKKFGVKFMVSTPTFLRGYIKQIAPDQFGSLKCIITGAEKLPNLIAENFELTFGVRPIEGYGATECSPVIATSTQDIREPGIYQIGHVQGTVGQTVPGVIAKIVDPISFDELEEDVEGLLLVKGPNVMEGYLNRSDLTSEVLQNGWYNTGDIALIDQNGFIKITGRMRRIAKIAGEMVPHGRVEEALHEAANSDDLVFAVTAIPDEKKGEKLVVLHTFDVTKLAGIIKKLAERGLSNLYIPSLDHFIKIDQLPILGSGKLDLQAIKKLALELCKQ